MSSFFLLWALLLPYTWGLEASESMCPKQEASCQDCIRYRDEKCVWCPADDISIGMSRCQSEEFHNTTGNWCGMEVENPRSSISNRSAPKNMNVGEGAKVHFYPQEMVAQIRLGSSVEVDVAYKLGREYPLDIYFVVDHSYSMTTEQYYIDNKNEKKATALQMLKESLKQVQKEIHHVATNVYLGMGAFMEKPVLPYAKPDALSFNHIVKLNPDPKEVIKSLHPKIRGGNNDDPEAALDGLLQAMVCKDQVGWRDVARRIIVLCTDGTYHSAGDGKLLGIFTPVDEQCRLVDNSYKKAATEYDYPSIGLMNKVAQEKKFLILFVAPKTIKKHYQALSEGIMGSVYVPLGGNLLSKNISYHYEKSLIYPKLIVKKPPNVEVTITPACEKEMNDDLSKECKVDLDKSKTVQVKLELISCPETTELQTVEIGLLGVESKLIIKVKPLCQCECEKLPVTKKGKCYSHGGLMCGLCSCDEGWGGPHCDCSTTKQRNVSDIRSCRFEKDTDICSGRGDCRCGKCERCVKSSGDYCQFDDEACPIFDDKLCAGHGICSLGRCNCEAGWTGPDCGCPLSTESCIPSFPRKECFGNGYCECGQCVCYKPNDTDVTYFGQFCQSSETRCNELNDIVICYYTKTVDECTGKFDSNNVDIEKMNKTNFNILDQATYILCAAPAPNGGLIQFKYQDFQVTQTDSIRVVIQNELDFPGLPAKVWVAIGSTIGVVVLVGVATLVIWKILIDRKDAREFAQFMKNIQEEQTISGENGLYQSATTSFSNPAFNRRSVYH